jgi:hypothetical protein
MVKYNRRKTERSTTFKPYIEEELTTKKSNCDYEGICIDYPAKCSSCKKNRNRKRSYYEPDINPYGPWYPIQWTYTMGDMEDAGINSVKYG